MGASPDSTLPGYGQLRDLVEEALNTCKETRRVEFRESQPWEVLKDRVVRGALAMANQSGGGTVIIGVSERGRKWALTGVKPADLVTYDPDKVTEQINSFASPAVDLDVVRHVRGKRSYIVISVAEFTSSPVICKKDSTARGDGRRRTLERGAIYVRAFGKAATVRVAEVSELHDLLGIAAERRARAVLRAAHRIGMVPGESDEARFDEELDSL